MSLIFKTRRLLFLLSLLLAVFVLSSSVSVSDTSQLLANENTKIVSVQDCDLKPAERLSTLPEGAQVTKTLNPDRISLLNWNIYKENNEGWQQDLFAFLQNHDVMTLQEAALDDPFLALLKNQDFNWVMNAAFYVNGTAAGVMNLAKVETIQSCGFKIAEPIIRLPKAALVSYYAIEGSSNKLLVANIHGINFSLGMESYRQQLEELYQAVAQHDGPMIIAGDFNSWSEERLAEVNSLLERLSLSSIEYPVNNKTHVFGNAIDHVFYRQLELLSNKVWQVTSSDHNPISVTFRYAPIL